MELSKLRLAPGTGLHIEINGNDGQKYPVKLIGFIPTKTVLITTPVLANGRPLLIRKDQEMVVRFFANKLAGAFKSKVRHICTTPYHYLHLTYPGSVETGEVRKAERVLANVAISAINNTRPEYDSTSGAIVDISTSGAKLETLQPIGKPGDILMLTAKVQVGRVTRVVTWEATIKIQLDKYEMMNSTAAYGIEFGYLNDLDYLAMQAYVNAQLVKGLQA